MVRDLRSNSVFDRYFAHVFEGLCQWKRTVVVLVAIATLTAVVGLKWVSLDNDFELMLPGDEEIRRSIRFLRESNFSDKVIISLELESSDHTPQDLIRVVDRLEGQLGPPFVTQVMSGVSGTDIVEEMLAIQKYVPQLFDEEALSRIGSKITPEGVDASLRRNYRQLVTPASTFMMPFVRSDPLGISSGILRSLQELSSSLGYEVELEDGHFVSRDQAHAMLILQTPIPVTDASGARELVTYLQDSLGELPDFVSGDIIAGHLHTISNEDVIKGDIWLALSIAGAAFALLFLFLFRDIRAVVLFLIPLVAVVISINLSNVILTRLSYFIVGMGGVVAGIAVDYGIHVYMVVRANNGRADAVKLVAKPVVTGGLTTLCVFAAFFFSSVQGYHQLALFSILSIVLCLLLALFLLPHFLDGTHRVGRNKTSRQHGLRRFRQRDGVITACWVAAVIAAVVSAKDLAFDSNIRRFDGSEQYVFEAEEKFHRVWGGRDQPAVFVVPGSNLELALRRNELVYQDAMKVVGAESFASLAPMWPLEEERAANVARWRNFWRQGKESELRRLLRQYGAAYEFSADAFAPFFENLYADAGSDEELESLDVFSGLKGRFIQHSPSGYRVLSYFPDEDRFVSRLSEISHRHPGTFLVSRNGLSQALSKSIASEIIYLAGIAALLIPLLACVLLRDIRLTALALVPVITGTLAVLGMIPVLGLFLNAPSIISAMVVVGLCIDYGIFVVYACHYALNTRTYAAVTISAVTTLIGTGVLLFARHPILFSIGVTMVTGVLAGYVSSMLVVPSMYRRFIGREGYLRRRCVTWY